MLKYSCFEVSQKQKQVKVKSKQKLAVVLIIFIFNFHTKENLALQLCFNINMVSLFYLSNKYTKY